MGGRRRFNPADYGTVALWLKADSLTGYEDEDVVDTWPDSSGNGNDATQGTFVKMPLYRTGQVSGMPALQFDGVDDSLFAALPIERPYTALVVYKTATGSTTGRSLSGGSSNWLLGSYNGRNGHHYAGGFVTDIGARNNDSLPHIATAIGGTTSSRCYHDGSDVTTSDDPTGTWGSGLSVGSNDGSNEFFFGLVLEVLVFSGALSDTQRQAVEQHLSQKYSITLS
jgi:hypothetical protein